MYGKSRIWINFLLSTPFYPPCHPTHVLPTPFSPVPHLCPRIHPLPDETPFPYQSDSVSAVIDELRQMCLSALRKYTGTTFFKEIVPRQSRLVASKISFGPSRRQQGVTPAISVDQPLNATEGFKSTPHPSHPSSASNCFRLTDSLHAASMKHMPV